MTSGQAQPVERAGSGERLRAFARRHHGRRLGTVPSMRRPGIRRTLLLGLATFLTGVSSTLQAESVTVAAAANFSRPLEALRSEFEAATDHEITVVSGSTGQLYAQIVHGAPFDILLAADQERPRLLAEQRWGEPSSLFTYALGRLALWSREPALIDESALGELAVRDFRWLAIANPDVAPYGAAARQALEALGAWPALQGRIVRGQSIAQTFSLIETGNADLGLVALSQALAYEDNAAHIIVPRDLHDPIRQDAILLRRARDNRAALEFMAFLKGHAAMTIIAGFGYQGVETAQQDVAAE